MHLIESAPHNLGRRELYAGVPANLVAFSCKASFEAGYEGVVAFTAKTKLITHYKNTLGAQLLYGNRMHIPEDAAKKLVNLYFKDYFNEKGESTI
jgi:hypothetical protein